MTSKRPQPAAERDPRYGSALWKKTRLAFRRQNPLCAHCQRAGLLRPGQYVDHIISPRDGGDFFAWANLQHLRAATLPRAGPRS